MISVCTLFYPWHRKWVRTHEVIDVLIYSLNKVKGVEDLELSIVDGGVRDIWKLGRVHDAINFKRDLRHAFKGKLKYELDERCIKRVNENREMFWGAKALEMAIDNSTHDYLFLVGIDIFHPPFFVDLFFDRVSVGSAWVVKAYNVPRGAAIEQKADTPGYGWHGARGIVGLSKADYYRLGGYESKNYVLRSSDSNFYRKVSSALRLTEETVDGFYHIGHPASNFANSKNWSVNEDNSDIIDGGERDN